MTQKPKIFLVEDDQNLGFVIKDNLLAQNFDVYLYENGEIAWQIFEKNTFDICILDIMMPKKDGFTLAQNIRQINKEIPIIFLTAKSMKEDKIKGFEIGADDYIIKPFNMEELVYRIKVFLKRTVKETIQNEFKIGSYYFNFTNLDLVHTNATKKLTQKEAALLKLLCNHKNEMIKRAFILQQIWGNDDYFSGRSMDVFISKLRKYLVHDSSIEIINYHGIGFKFSYE
ncbi:MAG: response regulator transcription factor [Bacteroidia bacterium]